MKPIIREADFHKISKIVFSGNYPGYRPNVVESPNGDKKMDLDKRYAHIATKYLVDFDSPFASYLEGFLDKAHELAELVACRAGVPDEFLPVKVNSALRILEYPPGAISNPHTDFDLLTLMLYRNMPENFIYTGDKPSFYVRELNDQVHYGEMMETIGLGKATPHEVIPSDEMQYSAVYFAIPPTMSRLPSGETVGEWLTERMSRSRYDKPQVEGQ